MKKEQRKSEVYSMLCSQDNISAIIPQNSEDKMGDSDYSISRILTVSPSNDPELTNVFTMSIYPEQGKIGKVTLNSSDLENLKEKNRVPKDLQTVPANQSLELRLIVSLHDSKGTLLGISPIQPELYKKVSSAYQ